MEENKKLKEGKQENVYTITFDLVNQKGIFLMPYEGQQSGEKFSQRFQLRPEDIIPEENFSWIEYYNIFENGESIRFTNSGMTVPGTYYDYIYPIVPIGGKVAIYAISKIPNPTGTEYIDIINNAWYVPQPFELKKMNIVVYEDYWSYFEHRYEDPQ